ncbi:MAG: O-methyltransferase [Bacteroidia bacterium]|nr:O-methyltransferase [Bacteroidia bacterium]
MEFINPTIEQYALNHTQPENDTLFQLNRETNLKVMMPRMLSGHLQGRILSMFSNMIKPKYILEIGTFTGYSAICLSEGLIQGGKLITIDINVELEKMVRNYFSKAEVTKKIDYRIGNALTIIPDLKEKFDLVFIDADKENYSTYYDLVFDKVNNGGFIIADNVLWSGKVLMDKDKMDKDTKAICDFNDKVHKDDRVEHLLLPVRDGLMIMRKQNKN